MASVKDTSGAKRNTPLFAPAGMMASFNTNLMKSAKLCSSPKAPTTFGPRRSCVAAHTLRSKRRRKASITKRLTVRRTMRMTCDTSQAVPYDMPQL